MAKKLPAKKVARKRAKVSLKTKKVLSKHKEQRLYQANARRAEERKAIQSDECHDTKSCDRAPEKPSREAIAYSEGERIGKNRALSEHPIASRISQLEGLKASEAHLLERELMNRGEAEGIQAGLQRTRENMERLKRELRGLMPDINATISRTSIE